jgi:EmrB/QacA subfamily drug resistance transporter
MQTSSAPAAPGQPPGKKIPYKWIALSVTTIGSLMAALDSTIVILALPDMMQELHADMVSMVWVMMAYLLVSTIFFLTFGRIADMIGRVCLYNLGFVIFTLGSVLCGLAGTAHVLIVFRLLQGIGASLLMVNSVAILTEAFPPEQRGLGIGINSVTWATGGVLGPILGGLILSAATWRWIFFINLPIGLFGTVWAYRALHEISVRTREETFDAPGAAMFSVGLTALLLFLTLGIHFGWTATAPLLALAAAMFILFYRRERRTPYPVLDLSLFRIRAYNYAVLAATMQSLAIFSVNFLIVFYLIGVHGFSPLAAALLLVPLPLALAVTAPVSGRVSDLIGARIPATLGLLIQSGALLWLTRLVYAAQYSHLVEALLLMGVGGGLFYAPNTSAAMSAAPPHRFGIASGALFTLRQSGMVTSYALSLAVAAASLPREIMLNLFVGTDVRLGSAMTQGFVVGMHNAFYVSTVLCLVAAFLSFRRGKTVPARKEAHP